MVFKYSPWPVQYLCGILLRLLRSITEDAVRRKLRTHGFTRAEEVSEHALSEVKPCWMAYLVRAEMVMLFGLWDRCFRCVYAVRTLMPSLPATLLLENP